LSRGAFVEWLAVADDSSLPQIDRRVTPILRLITVPFPF
jgi:hypothetical protein